MKRRVVVTGMGMVSPLGNDMASSWKGITEGRSCIGPLTNVSQSYLDRFTTRSREVRDFDITAATNSSDFRVTGKMPRRWTRSFITASCRLMP